MHLQSNLTYPVMSINLTSADGGGGGAAGNTTTNATKATAVASDDCNEWQDAQHFLYQLAHLCLTVAFLLPYSFQYHALCMRGVLLLGSVFLVIWSGSVVCYPDTLGWYTAFLVINLAYFCYASYGAYPGAFHPELEDLYVRMFKPLRLSRCQFRELTAYAQIKDLPNGATYALEGATHLGEKLSILLTGRLKVSCEQLLLHTIEANQFVDSPEYETAIAPSIDPDESYQVSISAMEDSRLLTWACSDLQLYLDAQPWMCSLLTVLLGKDITHKLHQVQELLLHNPQYMRIITSQCSLLQLRHQAEPRRDSSGGAPAGFNTLLLQHRAGSPDGMSSPGSKGSRGRALTPVRTGSPSQHSWETCV